MRALIGAGADVNKTSDNGVTPLFAAALRGREAIVRALIGFGADVNAASVWGSTALSVSRTAAIGQILRDNGAVR